VNDRPSKVFIQWFVSEQVEEEKNASRIVDILKKIPPNSAGIFQLDHQLGKRSRHPGARARWLGQALPHAIECERLPFHDQRRRLTGDPVPQAPVQPDRRFVVCFHVQHDVTGSRRGCPFFRGGHEKPPMPRPRRSGYTATLLTYHSSVAIEPMVRWSRRSLTSRATMSKPSARRSARPVAGSWVLLSRAE